MPDQADMCEPPVVRAGVNVLIKYIILEEKYLDLIHLICSSLFYISYSASNVWYFATTIIMKKRQKDLEHKFCHT